MSSSRKFGSSFASLLLMITSTICTVTASILLTNFLPLPVLSQNIQSSSSILPSGSELPRGSAILSPKGKYLLWLQDDGNFVLYYKDLRRGRLVVYWATDTSGRAVAKAAMQTDGNFVLYTYNGKPVWASNTHGHPGAWLQVQDDGNVVIYTRSGNRVTPIWEWTPGSTNLDFRL